MAVTPKPSAGPLPATDVQRLLAYELGAWEHDLRPLWADWDRWWSKWHIRPVDPATNPFLSQMQVPYSMYAVEVLVPRILGEEPTMAYQPVDEDHDDLAATLLGKVVTMQMRRMGFDTTARGLIRQALITGYSPAKVWWDRRTARQLQETEHSEPIDPRNPELGSTTVIHATSSDVVVRNDPRVDLINNKDFIYPLIARSLDEAPAVYQRVWMTKRRLDELGKAGIYQNTDDVRAWDNSKWSEAYQKSFEDFGLHPQAVIGGDPGNPTGGLVEIWERWEDDRLTVFANRQVVLHDGPNPFWHKKKPFIDFTPQPDPFQLGGVGTMRTLADSNDHLDTMMRQACDAVTFLLNPAWKVTEGADRDSTFVLQPGARWVVEDGEDVQPLINPAVDFNAFAAMRQEIIQDMQRASGVFELIGGAFPFQGSRTATGMSTIVSEGTKRITEMIQILNYRTLRRFGQFMMQMNAQYLDSAILVDLTDDPRAQTAWQQLAAVEKPTSWLVAVEPQMVQAKGRLEPLPEVGQDKALSDQQKRSDATQALQAVAPILASPQNPLNMKALADKTLKDFGWSAEDRAKVLETPQVQEQAAWADAQPNGAPSGPSGPSGDNLPTGGVVGAIGASGPVGAPRVNGR